MTRYKIIVNPAAGRGQGQKSHPVIAETLDALGLDFEMCTTDHPGHAIQLAQEAVAAGFKVVAAAGGDGTVNEVLNGLVLARRSGGGEAFLGVLPVGRGNDFCFGVGIPTDLEAACEVLAHGRPTRLDIGFVQGGDYPDGRYFGNGVGIGFDAVVGFEALKLKRLHGFPSYIVAALKTILLYFQAPDVQIEIDGIAHVQPALMVSIMNGRRMGGGFMMAPDGKVDDGQFDLCLVGQVSRLGILGLIPRFMQGTQAGHPAVTTARAAEIRVSALKGSLPAHGDGETLCVAGESLAMKILPGELAVITPAGDGAG